MASALGLAAFFCAAPAFGVRAQEPSAAGGEAPDVQCDRLAGTPSAVPTAGGTAKPIPFDAELAIAACARAREVFAHEPRFAVQLARVLVRAGRGQEALAVLEPLAGSNDRAALRLLARMKSRGLAIPKDEAEGARLFRRAADMDDPESLNELGTMYEAGRGVAKDAAEAARLYRRAAELGDTDGEVNLGLLYVWGIGVPVDLAEANRWFRDAASRGSARAKFSLGYSFETGRGLDQNYGEAARLYREAGEGGVVGGWRNLGVLYEKGLGVEKNVEEAARLYQLAALEGDGVAMANLASAYEDGRGVPVDGKKAASLYLQAGEKGVARAYNNLGWMYERGSGVEQNDAEAARFYRKAADLEYGLGYRNLGDLYEKGRGVPKNEAEACRLYRRAIALGDTRAKVRLALLLQDGLGEPKDETAALKLLQEAVDQKDTMAPRVLAKLKDRIAGAASEARSRSRTGPAALAAEALEAGRLKAGERTLRRHLAAQPDDPQALFGLGAVQFLSAIEHLSQELYRYGLAPARGLPLVALPLPLNPHPARLDYERFRGILERFSSDLDQASRTLARVGDRPVKVPVDLAAIQIDLTGRGERLMIWSVLAQLNAVPPKPQERRFVSFDTADAAWLEGYSHLLMAVSNFMLAHDFRRSFEDGFHLFFPRAGLRMQRASSKSLEPGFETDIADAIALVHAARWPVVSRGLLASVPAHLLAVAAMSRSSLALAASETDDEDEWIPSLTQTPLFRDLRITQEQHDAWLSMLGELEALLRGKALVPHWRFDRGFDLARFFRTETNFDPVMLVTGPGALPYLRRGRIIGREDWSRITDVFEGNFVTYLFWLN